MEAIIFAGVIGMIICISFFGLGISIGRGLKKDVPEISDEADVLAADLRLMAATSGLSNGEKSKLNKAADYIENLGEIKSE